MLQSLFLPPTHLIPYLCHEPLSESSTDDPSSKFFSAYKGKHIVLLLIILALLFMPHSTFLKTETKYLILSLPTFQQSLAHLHTTQHSAELSINTFFRHNGQAHSLLGASTFIVPFPGMFFLSCQPELFLHSIPISAHMSPPLRVLP